LPLNHLHFESDKILSSLPPSDKEYFLSYAQSLTFKKGKLIFYEGGIATGAFLVKSGRAKIYKTGIYGKDQIFYIYKRGDLFGYHALLANEPYEDSCEALEDCEVLFINKKNFEHLLEHIRKLKLLFIQNMSHEFGVLVIGTARESLGRLLKEFKEEQLIVIKGRTIEIANFDKIKKVANLSIR